MSKQKVTIHQAKTHLSRLLKEVAAGGEVIIAHGDRPVARLVPIDAPLAPRQPGRERGKVWMAADFMAPLPPDWQAGFEE